MVRVGILGVHCGRERQRLRVRGCGVVAVGRARSGIGVSGLGRVLVYEYVGREASKLELRWPAAFTRERRLIGPGEDLVGRRGRSGKDLRVRAGAWSDHHRGHNLARRGFDRHGGICTFYVFDRKRKEVEAL